MSKFSSSFLLILISLILLLPGIQKLPVIDRDEAHFAQATKQMLESGKYFQVRFQEVTRYQKPPGINWLQAGSVKFLGDSEKSSIWPYRFPSVLGALLSVLFTFYFALKFVNLKTAWLAAAFLGSTLLFLIEAHMAVIDTSLLCSVLLMQGALWVIYANTFAGKPVSWLWPLLFWLAMAYGLLLKGVTPLVGVLTVVCLAIWERDWRWLKGLKILSGLSLFLGLSLAWLWMLNQAEHSNYFMQMIQKDLLPKLKGGHESHGQPPLFHLFLLPLTFWPASLFLWQGTQFAIKNKSQRLIRFLLAWIIPTWIFFELMPTKLPQYILPTFPAIALLCALALLNIEKYSKPSRTLHVLQFLWGILSVGLAFAIALLPYLVFKQITLLSVCIFLMVGSLSIFCVYYAWRGYYQKAALSVVLTSLISFPFLFAVVFPQLNPVWVSRNAADLVKKHSLPVSPPLVVIGFNEPSLVFYLGTKQVVFKDNLSSGPLADRQLILLDKKVFEQLPPDINFVILETTQGFNYSKGKWVELILGQQFDGPANLQGEKG